MCVSSCENAPFNHWKVSDNEGGSSWDRLEVSEFASGKSLSSDISVTSEAGSVRSDMSAAPLSGNYSKHLKTKLFMWSQSRGFVNHNFSGTSVWPSASRPESRYSGQAALAT